MGGPAERKVDFLNKILPLIQPGDVINFDSTTEWYNLHIHLAYKAIRCHQRQMFGNLSRWRDVHSMLYLDEDQVFSVEPPRARFAQLEELYEDTITLWRYTKREFSDEDIEVMHAAAAELDGTVYDVGQLLDIAINHIMGYPHAIHYKVFDFSKYCKVCSVGVRVCYEALRKHLEQQGAEPPMKRLFSSFKYDTWLESDIVMNSNTELRGVDVEATSPAHFANSECFDDEFEMVAQFDRGQQVYPPPPQPAAQQPEAGAAEADHGHGDHEDHDGGHGAGH
jgi:hypothetical protein